MLFALFSNDREGLKKLILLLFVFFAGVQSSYWRQQTTERVLEIAYSTYQRFSSPPPGNSPRTRLMSHLPNSTIFF